MKLRTPELIALCRPDEDVVKLDEAEMGALRNVLIEWMGWEGSR